MSDAVNGGGGIPIAGREVEYATELWLDSPSAFWLHPEGPLSDKTPDEWLAETAAERERKAAEEAAREAAERKLRMKMYNAQLLGQMVGLQNALTGNPYMNQYGRQNQGLGGLLGIGRLF